MLHRLALRVLPSLTLAVTEEQVRKRKRLVMFVPGLVAYAVYRGAKHMLPLSDAVTLLVLSGCISTVTALAAYRVGRGVRSSVVWLQDGPRRIGWVAGWIGFVYGIQLSLLVLALLKILAGYDFLRHPDGPALMAIIIACTSVARDAFEIGHIRRLESTGTPIITFPDGAPLRHLLREQPQRLLQWVVVGAVSAACLSLLAWSSLLGQTALGQFAVASLIGGTLALLAYLAGEQRAAGLRVRVGGDWPQLFRFWWWPGLAFAATYYLALAGLAVFVLKRDLHDMLLQAGVVTGVGMLMALYGYYLGVRRQHEDRIKQLVPAPLLRCPFVMGILNKGEPALPLVPSTRDAMPTGTPERVFSESVKGS